MTASAAVDTQSGRSSIAQLPLVYENATITEDVSWHGAIVIKGSLVVSPQATLRIEPGTEVRFMPSKGMRQLPRLVVMGRIQGAGTLDHPILFSSISSGSPKQGSWGGILLLSSEKRNQLEHCRIEGADTALEGSFSHITLKSLAITSSKAGIMLRDSIAALAMSSVSGCETGIEAHDSELELRETTIAQNSKGAVLSGCALVMSSVTISGNTQYGLLTDACRIKLTSCEIIGNGVGAHIKGGEGQLFLCRFMRNSATALHLSMARIKVNRCQIIENLHDGLLLEDGRVMIWGNSFSGNGGYNLVNGGPDNINAPLNWWGAADETSVRSKLFDASTNGRIGVMNVFPWLLEKPALLP